MKPNPIKVAMIRAAANKGIADIKENPGRGIRNLVEIGGMFAGGRFQKEFFDVASGQLVKDGIYYSLAEEMVTQVESNMLCNFGINLGYNSMSHGADIIRQTEEREGFNVPWSVVIETGHGEDCLPSNVIDRVMEEGKELGIYSYIFFIGPETSQMSELLDLCYRHEDCAIFFMIDPSLVDLEYTNRVLSKANVFTAIDIGGSELSEIERGANLLLVKGCLCGGFTKQPGLQAEQVDRMLLSKAAYLGLPIFVSVGEKNQKTGPQDHVYKRFVEFRKALDIPVLPIDLYGDMVHVDRIISSEGCIATIMSDGTMTFVNADGEEGVAGFNIKDMTLEEGLRKTLPKKVKD